jgi:hypothetical protein
MGIPYCYPTYPSQLEHLNIPSHRYHGNITELTGPEDHSMENSFDLQMGVLYGSD